MNMKKTKKFKENRPENYHVHDNGWFDDPIGLSVRAYILVPPIALGKFLLAWPHLIP